MSGAFKNLDTIDGEDARDFDDAVYCEKRIGGWRLYVAIADVSHYVRPGMALDEEANPTEDHTYWTGFADRTATGLRFETRRAGE